MKVVAFNGSPRKEGNTAILLNEVLGQLSSQGIETELLQLGGQVIRGCIACGRCAELKNKKCAITNDPINDYIELCAKADAVLLGSPTYFADVTAELKAFIDRVGMVGMVNGAMFKRKAGAAVVAVRRGGSVHAFDTINHFFQISQMFTIGSSYWNMGYGRNPGEVKQDEEGLQTMQNLGKNMAWLLKCIDVARTQIPEPETLMVKRTSFIR
ncbi:MAG: flavodoxin family protein [Candidatus Rifleibacteriota bacterium]